MTDEVLSHRALGRATLDRQFLLDRSHTGIVAAIEHLVGLQAQVPHDPYLGLFSRLAGFDPESLSQLLWDRAVVRIVVMRGTIHLVSADDALVLRPLVQPVLDQEMARHGQYATHLRDVDLEPVIAFARPFLEERPRTGHELRRALTDEFPEANAAALALACRNLLAIVQVPPRGIWGRAAAPMNTTAQAWLGRPIEANPSIDRVVVRYLAAFGPASAADLSTWCRLTGMGEVLDRLRPMLRTFRDERGRELFDLPDANRPDPDTPAPTRFLPEYDNILLSHADRSRFVSDDDRRRLSGAGGRAHGTVLHDGTARAVWTLSSEPDRADVTVTIRHVGRLSERARSSIAAEARRMLRFSRPGRAEHDIRIVRID